MNKKIFLIILSFLVFTFSATIKAESKATPVYDDTKTSYWQEGTKEETKTYLQNCTINAEETANGIVEILKNGGSDEEAINFFMNRYYKGYAKEIYPIDAITLNTTIMVNLIKKELLQMV